MIGQKSRSQIFEKVPNTTLYSVTQLFYKFCKTPRKVSIIFLQANWKMQRLWQSSGTNFHFNQDKDNTIVHCLKYQQYFIFMSFFNNLRSLVYLSYYKLLEKVLSIIMQHFCWCFITGLSRISISTICNLSTKQKIRYILRTQKNI